MEMNIELSGSSQPMDARRKERALYKAAAELSHTDPESAREVIQVARDLARGATFQK